MQRGSRWLTSDVVDAESWIAEDELEVLTVGRCSVANLVTEPRDFRPGQSVSCRLVVRCLKYCPQVSE